MDDLASFREPFEEHSSLCRATNFPSAQWTGRISPIGCSRTTELTGPWWTHCRRTGMPRCPIERAGRGQDRRRHRLGAGSCRAFAVLVTPEGTDVVVSR